MTGLASRILTGHRRSFAGLAAGLATWFALPALPGGALAAWPSHTRGILAWDAGSCVFLALSAALFARRAPDGMAEEAEAQEDGQWTLFWVTLLGTVASFVALTGQFSGLKDAPDTQRTLQVSLGAATLLLSWLLTHVVFCYRYAHEWYDRDAAGTLKQGLAFPGDDQPDYGDFLYFSLVLGMTFQVSDVEIGTRRLRRLATLHGLISFLFNTVIVALTVNTAAGLL